MPSVYVLESYQPHNHVSGTVFEIRDIYKDITRLIKQIVYVSVGTLNILFHLVLKIQVYYYSIMYSSAFLVK